MTSLAVKQVEPQREFPRWTFCSVNHCPLDPLQDDCESHDDDKEPKCTLAKSIRHRIGSKYPDLLPMLGLKPREWAGKQAFERLSPSAKAERVAAGKSALNRHNQTKTTKTT